MKYQIFHIIDTFPTRNENLILRTHKFLVYFQKAKMKFSQARFKWTNDKLINFRKCFQEFKSSMDFRSCESNTDKVKLHALFISNSFFNSASVLLHFFMNWVSNWSSFFIELRLSVAYYIQTWSYSDMLDFAYLYPCLRLPPLII